MENLKIERRRYCKGTHRPGYFYNFTIVDQAANEGK